MTSAAVLLALCCLGLLFHRLAAALIRLLGRSAVGLVFLALLSGPLAGIAPGVNLLNALFLGLLGIPGFGLLLLLRWALQ